LIYLTWAHDTEVFPYQPEITIDLRIEDGFKVERDFAVDLEGNVDETNDHVSFVTYDEAHEWYPLTEVFPKAKSDDWGTKLPLPPLGIDSSPPLTLRDLLRRQGIFVPPLSQVRVPLTWRHVAGQFP
jgi:hypothetical protein